MLLLTYYPLYSQLSSTGYLLIISDNYITNYLWQKPERRQGSLQDKFFWLKILMVLHLFWHAASFVMSAVIPPKE